MSTSIQDSSSPRGISLKQLSAIDIDIDMDLDPARATAPIQPPQVRPMAAFFAPSTRHDHPHPRRAMLLLDLLRLVLFHALNTALGVTGFICVLGSAALCVCLLPLCCFGIVVLRAVLSYIAFLAEFDVSLFNFLAPTREQIVIGTPRCSRWAAAPSSSIVRLSPDIASFSSGALLVSFYFITIKFMVAMMSCMALLLTLAFPITAAADSDLGQVFFASASGWLAFVLLSAVFAVLGVGFMNFAASISLGATRFFCCEKWSLQQSSLTARMQRSSASMTMSASRSSRISSSLYGAV